MKCAATCSGRDALSDSRLYNLFNNVRLLAKGSFRYRALQRRIEKIHPLDPHASLARSARRPAKRVAHFHFNILPDSRKLASTRALTDAYFKHLRAFGEKRVYGQVVVFEDRRGAKLFERYGFKVLNKSEITKYRHLYPEPVYLCTVIKDLA